MRPIICFFAAMAVVLSCQRSLAEPPVVVEEPAGRILVYTRNFTPDGKGFVHDNLAASSAAVVEIAAKHRLAGDISDDPAVFTPENLARYRVVVFCNTNNEAFSEPAQSAALMDFVRRGGGFVGIHSATGSERKNPEFRRLVGGLFVWHTPNQPFDVVVSDATHPATRHLPATWRVKDEGYLCKMEPGLRILMEMKISSVAKPPKHQWKMDVTGDRYPLAWCQDIGQGRSFYTALGHDIAFYADPVFRRHLEGGIVWAAKLDP